MLKDTDKMDSQCEGACSIQGVDNTPKCAIHSDVNTKSVTSDIADSALSSVNQSKCDNSSFSSLHQSECDNLSFHQPGSFNSSMQRPDSVLSSSQPSNSASSSVEQPECPQSSSQQTNSVPLLDSVSSTSQASPRSSLQRQQRIWTSLNIAEMNNNSQASISLNEIPQDETEDGTDASADTPTEGNAVFMWDELIDHDYSKAQEDALFGGVLRCILDNMTVGQLYASIRRMSLEDRQPMQEGDDDVFENVWSDEEAASLEASITSPCT